MKRHQLLPKKLWMSLIELLVVITIIWILIWVLVPTIWNTQWKTRDITRQSQIQELASALMSYKLDYWEFPVVPQTIHVWVEDTTQYRWDIRILSTPLKEWWYITKIPKDPAELSLVHSFTDSEQFNYTSNWYYLYLSDGKSFMIITPVEDEKNWNSPINQENIVYLLQRIGTNATEYENFFNWANWNNEWQLYIYKYKEEIL